MSSKSSHHKLNTEDLTILYTAIYPEFCRHINFGWLFIAYCLKIRNDSKTIHMGGMVTWIAHALGFEDMCNACDAVDNALTLDLPTLKNYHFLCGSLGGPTFAWMVGGAVYCHLPNAKRTYIGDNFRRWIFPKEGEDSEDSDREEEDDDDDDRGHNNATRDADMAHAPPEHPFHGAGSSSTPSFFDPTTAFPPHYFGNSTTPPPPPRDPYDLAPMYHMIAQLHANTEIQRRVTWHDHVHLVDRGYMPGFANHPHYPPVFDDQPPPPFPYPRPPPPPPNDD